MGRNMAEEQQAKLNIDGNEYNLADLSDHAKAQLASVRHTDAEIKRLNMQLAIAQTARNAYMQELQSALSEN